MITISTRLFATTTLSLALLTPVLAQANAHFSSDALGTVDYIKDHGVTIAPSSDGGSLVVLETDLGNRSQSQLRVLLGKDGMFEQEADLGPLANISGLQVLKAPASLDVERYNEIHVWSPDANAVVGIAPLR